jgi:hypothetical protein
MAAPGTASATGRHLPSLMALTDVPSLVTAAVVAAASGGVASVALTPPSTALIRSTVDSRHVAALPGGGGAGGVAGGVAGNDGRQPAS